MVKAGRKNKKTEQKKLNESELQVKPNIDHLFQNYIWKLRDSMTFWKFKNLGLLHTYIP